MFAGNDRVLGAALGISIALHAAAMAVHFRVPDAMRWKSENQPLEVVLVNARVAVIGTLPALPAEPRLPSRAPVAARGHRRAYLGGWRELPLYRLDDLAPGQTLDGPALVESDTTTVLLRSEEQRNKALQFAPKQRKMLSFILAKPAEGWTAEQTARQIEKETGYDPHAARARAHVHVVLLVGRSDGLGHACGSALARSLESCSAVRERTSRSARTDPPR